MGWAPTEDWGQKVLVKSLADEGESQTLEAFDIPDAADGGKIAIPLEEFIQQCRKAY